MDLPRRLRTVTALLALCGVGVAGYLTWVHYAGLEPFCAGGGGGCERVQNSRYADLAGMPVSVIGLAGYLAILASLAVLMTALAATTIARVLAS